MALPPFNPDENVPQPNDLISQYPPEETTFRDIIESWILWEHDRNGNHDHVGLADKDAATPAGTTGLVTVWQEAGVLKSRFGTGAIDDFVLVAAAGGTIDPAILDFATQAEAEAGTADDVIMSPLRTQQHYDAQTRFVVELTSVQVFDSPVGNPQTYTPAADLRYVKIHCVGGGAGGGDQASTATDGGTTNVGTLAVANGGSVSPANSTGGAGGTGGTGTVTIDGGRGHAISGSSGTTANSPGGDAAGPFGGFGGQRAGPDDMSGQFAGGGGGFEAPGGHSGGGGEYAFTLATAAQIGASQTVNVGAGGDGDGSNGRPGADGIVVIEEYTLVAV